MKEDGEYHDQEDEDGACDDNQCDGYNPLVEGWIFAAGRAFIWHIEFSRNKRTQRSPTGVFVFLID